MLLDRSGSMETQWVEAINSINAYVNNLENRACRVCLAAFDNISFDIIRDSSVGNWVNVSNMEIQPRGSTPLFDSVAKIVDLAKNNNDPRTILVIMSDGAENSSKEYTTTSAIRSKLDSIKDRDWPTVFLGANFQEIGHHTQSFGINTANSVYCAARNLSNFTTNLANSSSTYFNTGCSATMSFAEVDKEQYK